MSEAEDLQTDGGELFRRAALRQLESLHRLSLHLCRDAALAEDLVQETYVLALKSAHTYRGSVMDIRPWMFKVMHNALRSWQRRSGRVVFDERLIVDTGEEGRAGLSGGELLGENAKLDELNWEQVEGGLKRAIDGLPDGVRIVFLLFAVEDLKYRQISEVVGIPVGTVMSRLARARKLLIERLSEDKSIEVGPMGVVGSREKQREALS
jgi:RNA polymerase sigma-70 factor (ECF subfamily)